MLKISYVNRVSNGESLKNTDLEDSELFEDVWWKKIAYIAHIRRRESLNLQQKMGSKEKEEWHAENSSTCFICEAYIITARYNEYKLSTGQHLLPYSLRPFIFARPSYIYNEMNKILNIWQIYEFH